MLANASTLPMAARSTGTSFAVTLDVTTGAAPPSPPRPRPRPPPPPGPAAEVLLPQAALARAVAPAAAMMRDRKEKRLNTVSSKLWEGTLIRVV